MIIVGYQKSRHKQIIHACVLAIRKGKIVAYPTDTSYGLAVDATNIKAIKKLYKVKGRNFNKPVHVVVPSIAYAKKIARWSTTAEKLAAKFWPGALTLVLPAGKKFIGLRMPNNKIALELAKHLKKPITATSANISGQADTYSANEIISQFKNKKHKPDIIINAGKLPRRKPSTVVKIVDDQIQILRQGPITQKQIKNVTQA